MREKRCVYVCVACCTLQCVHACKTLQRVRTYIIHRWGWYLNEKKNYRYILLLDVLIFWLPYSWTITVIRLKVDNIFESIHTLVSLCCVSSVFPRNNTHHEAMKQFRLLLFIWRTKNK